MDIIIYTLLNITVYFMHYLPKINIFINIKYDFFYVKIDVLDQSISANKIN